MTELVRRDADGVVHVDHDLAVAIRQLALQAVRTDADSVNAALRQLDANWRAVIDDLAAQLNEAFARRSGPLVLNVVPAPPVEPRTVRKTVEHDDAGRITAVIEEPQP